MNLSEELKEAQTRFQNIVAQISMTENQQMQEADREAAIRREIDRLNAWSTKGEELIAARPPRLSYEEWVKVQPLQPPSLREIEEAKLFNIDLEAQNEATRQSWYLEYVKHGKVFTPSATSSL